MENDECADILGPCKSFLEPNMMDQQVTTREYDFIRKDRMDTQNKSGGGLILYFRNSIKCKRRHEYETKIQTIGAEIELPNTKIVSEYDQEIPQSQTAGNPMTPRGRATQQSRDTRKTN